MTCGQIKLGATGNLMSFCDAHRCSLIIILKNTNLGIFQKLWVSGKFSKKVRFMKTFKKSIVFKNFRFLVTDVIMVTINIYLRSISSCWASGAL